jgi:hypothetical protein
VGARLIRPIRWLASLDDGPVHHLMNNIYISFIIYGDKTKILIIYDFVQSFFIINMFLCSLTAS